MVEGIETHLNTALTGSGLGAIIEDDEKAADGRQDDEAKTNSEQMVDVQPIHSGLRQQDIDILSKLLSCYIS